MFDFIRKHTLWQALDAGYLEELEQKISYQLKSAQDLAVYSLLRDCRGLDMAEIGGGDSRLLRRLAKHNRCCNIDRFEGANCGPQQTPRIEGVRNILTFLGEFDPRLPEASFDAVFSISVVEHLRRDTEEAFHHDLLRILKPGGLFLHAIDFYLGDEPSAQDQRRMGTYRAWISEPDRVEPLGEVREIEPRFQCDMASNPDHILHGWGRFAPRLIEVRKICQNVSLLVGGHKLDAG
ncbi:SAM-dependent methyltransferase [Thiocystis violacea]|uniref:SAM-dependent methyltransferase n=1 Tax=Thiocystis violacea TaxID=13725 RepID=UPI001908362A|nr:class I SAM-dependent methyltransferase [Thiocystis violacea]MBK1720034.1 hypothetical protein [Thiocystis violacea]